MSTKKWTKLRLALAILVIGGAVTGGGGVIKAATELTDKTGLGVYANASGTNTVAVGLRTNAYGANSMTFGIANNSNGQDSITIGSSNSATLQGAMAFGLSNYVNQKNATALGFQNYVNGTADLSGGVAIGTQNYSSGGDAVAVGKGTAAAAKNSVAFGQYAAARGINSVSIGSGGDVTFNTGTVGSSAYLESYSHVASGNYSIAVGYKDKASAEGAVSVGYTNTAQGKNSVAVGANSIAWTDFSLVYGQYNYAGGTSSKATAGATGAMAIGQYNQASAQDAIAIGSGKSEKFLQTATGTQSIAVGYTNAASGDGAIAIGASNKSYTGGSISFGNSNYAGGTSDGTSGAGYAVALGYSNTAAGQYAQAIGNSNTANAAYTIAVGSGNKSWTTGSITYGSSNYAGGTSDRATSNATYAVALGYGNTAAGRYSQAIGNSNTANAANTIAVGSGNKSWTTGSITYGSSNYAGGTNSGATSSSATYAVALGYSNTAADQYAQAIGNSNIANAANTIAVGSGNKSWTTGSITYGSSNYAGGTNSGATSSSATYAVALGYSNRAADQYAQAIGSSNTANAANTIAMGTSNNAYGTHGIAIGSSNYTGRTASEASISNHYATAIGSYNVASGSGSVAIGTGSTTDSQKATGKYSVAMGYGNKVASQYAMAYGYGNEIVGSTTATTVARMNSDETSQNAIAVGQSNTITGQSSMAYGSSNKITAQNAIAVGQSNTITGQSSMAYGSSNKITAVGGVAIGSGNTLSYTSTTAKPAMSTIVMGESNTVAASESVVLGKGITVGTEDTVLAIGTSTKNANGSDKTKMNIRASNAIAIGAGITVGDKADKSLTVGIENSTTGAESLIYGFGNQATSDSTMAFGDTNTVSAKNSMALGAYNKNYATESFAAGINNQAGTEGAGNKNTMALGNLNKIYASNAIGIGLNSSATKESENSINIGIGSSIAGANSMSYGLTNTINAASSVAIGAQNTVNGTGAIAMGASNTVNAQNALVFGRDTTVGKTGTTYSNIMSFGASNTVYTEDTIALGSNIKVGVSASEAMLLADDDDTASGRNVMQGIGITVAEGVNRSTAIGGSNTVSGSDSVALGYQATVSGNEGTAIGHAANAGSNTSTAIGSGAQAAHANSVALGAGSVVGETNSVSVGTTTQTRKIQNVTQGTISTDAATFGQVAKLNQEVDLGTKNTIVNNSNQQIARFITATVAQNNTGFATGGDVWNKAGNGIAAAVSYKDGNGSVTLYNNDGSKAFEITGITQGEGKTYTGDGKTIDVNEASGVISAKTNGIAQNADTLVTGDTIYTYTNPTADVGAVKTGQNVATNLTNLAKADVKAGQTIDGDNTTIKAVDGTTTLVTISKGAVEAGSKGFVTGGDVYNKQLNVGDFTFNADTNKAPLTTNDGTSLGTITIQNGTVAEGDKGYISGDTAWKNSVKAGQTIDGNNLSVYSNGSPTTNPVITISKGEIASGDTGIGFVTGNTVYNKLINNTTYGVNYGDDGKSSGTVTVQNNDGTTAFTITGIEKPKTYTGEGIIEVDNDKNVIKANVNGKIEKDNTGLVTGGDIYNYLTPTGDTYNTINKTNTLIQNLEALDSADVKKNQNVSLNTETVDGKQGNTIVDNNNNVLATFKKGTVAENNDGFISGHDVWSSELAAGSHEFTSAANSVELKTKGGTSLGTISIATVKDADLTNLQGNTSYVSGDILWKSTIAGGTIDGDNLSLYTNADTTKTNPVVTIKKGEVAQNNKGFTTGDTVWKSDVKNSNYEVAEDGTVTVQNNNGGQAFKITGLSELGKYESGTPELLTVDNKTKKISVIANGTVTEGNTGLITGDTLYDEVRPTTDGKYISNTQSTAENLKDLDDAIGEVKAPTGSTWNVIDDTKNADGSIKTTMAQNIEKLDAKIGAIDGTISQKFETINNWQTEYEGLVKLNEAKDQIQIGTGDNAKNATTVAVGTGVAGSAAQNRKLVNVANGEANTDAATYGQIAKANQTIYATTSDMTADKGNTLGNVIYDNAGNKLATLNIGSVAAGDNSFVSGGQVYQKLVKNQEYTVSYTTEADGKQYGSVTVLDNDGNTAFTIKNIKTEKDGDASTFVPYSGDSKTISITDDTHVISAITGGIAADNEGLVTGATLHSELRPTTDGTYVKAGNTTAQNLDALDDAIGEVPAASTYKVIAESKNGDGTIKTTVSQNLINLDKGLQDLETNVNNQFDTINQWKTSVDGLVKLSDDKTQILVGSGDDAKNATSIDMGGSKGGRTLTNVVAGTNLTDAANVSQLIDTQTIYATTDTSVTDTTKKNVIYDKAGNEVVTMHVGTVSAGNIGFISGGQVHDAIVNNQEYAVDYTAGKKNGTVTVYTNAGDGKTTQAFKITGIDGSGEVYQADGTTITLDSTTNTFSANTTTTISNDAANGGKLVTAGTVYTEVRPTDGSYVKTTQTTAENLKKLDEAIDQVAADGNVIKKTYGTDGSISTTVSDNIELLDNKIGAINDGNTNIVKNNNTVSKNLEELDKAIKDNKDATDSLIKINNAGDTIVIGEGKTEVTNVDMGDRYITNVKGGDSTGDVATWDQLISKQTISATTATRDGDATKQQNILYDNANNAVATFNIATGVNSASGTGFVSEGVLYKALPRGTFNVTYTDNVGTVDIKDSNNNTLFTIGNILSTGTGTAGTVYGDNVTTELDTSTGVNVIKAKTGDVSATNAGLVTGQTVHTYVTPTQGQYVNTTNTTGQNLKALDDAIGAVRKDAGADDFNVIKETFAADGTTQQASAADNIKALDKKVGKIDDTKTETVKNDNDISTNLELLDKKIKANKDETDSLITKEGDTIYIGKGDTTVNNIDMGDSYITNVKPGDSTGDVATWDQVIAKQVVYASDAARAEDANKKENIIYNNAGQEVVTLQTATVNSGDKGFVSGGQLWSNLPKDQTFDVVYTSAGKGTVDIYNNAGEKMFSIGNILKLAVGEEAKAAIHGDNKTIQVSDATGTNVISAITTGGVGSGNENLVTGGQVHEYVTPTADGNYIKKDNTAAGNFKALDDAIGKVDADGNVIKKTYADDGTIQNSASDNIKLLDEKIGTINDGSTQTVKNDYTISKNLELLDQKIQSEKQEVNNLITKEGDTIKIGGGVSNVTKVDMGDRYITNVKPGEKSGDAATWDQVGKLGQTITLNPSTDLSGKAGNTLVNNAGDVIATFQEGTITKGDQNFISGGAVYNEVRPTDGVVVKNAYTTANNLNAIDNALIKNDTYKVAKDGTVTILNNGGDTAFVISGLNGGASGGVYYGDDKTIKIEDDGTISAITGDISSDNEGLVTGKTLYEELRPEDGTYIKKDNTAAGNFTALDNAIKDRDNLIKKDGDTIHIGSGDTTTKINVSNGNGENRVITGVATDSSDGSSAANVDYVNSRTSDLIGDIIDAGATAAALAGLHPMTYDPNDKLSFAVAGGAYRGTTAFAMGGYYQPNEDMMFSVAGTIGSRYNMWNIGMSFRLGKREDRKKLYGPGMLLQQTVAEMSQREAAREAEMAEIREENKNLRADNEELRADNEELRAQVAQIMQHLNLTPEVRNTATAQ